MQYKKSIETVLLFVIFYYQHVTIQYEVDFSSRCLFPIFTVSFYGNTLFKLKSIC